MDYCQGDVMTEIAQRFVELINAHTVEGRRFTELEKFSGIAAVSWRKAYNAGQRPTAEMLEALARRWPQHAFWLATGLTDNEFSHTAPNGSGVLDTAFEPRPAGAELLRMRAELHALLEGESKSLRDRWEDWLTEHQERNQKKMPWLYSVHPALQTRKMNNQQRAQARADRIKDLVAQIDSARKKRIAEFQAIYGDKAN